MYRIDVFMLNVALCCVVLHSKKSFSCFKKKKTYFKEIFLEEIFDMGE